MSLGHLHKAFTAALLDCLPRKLHHKLESWMAPAQLSLVGKRSGNGIQLAHFYYVSAISIEDVPFTQVDTATLLAQAAAWLIDNDEHRYLLEANDSAVTVKTEVVDEGKIDIALEVSFIELLELIPDEQGSVKFNGQHWCIAAPEVDIAETITVVACHE
ncbi:phage tail protein [Ferrimonas senticii]|uniref:phage tail protein n=1 Tax=Ferrimonas senticii TaxID=394566 RepID=UPI0003FBCE48|nr:phage tail protein [Ferrimonas senticii]